MAAISNALKIDKSGSKAFRNKIFDRKLSPVVSNILLLRVSIALTFTIAYFPVEGSYLPFVITHRGSSPKLACARLLSSSRTHLSLLVQVLLQSSTGTANRKVSRAQFSTKTNKI